MINKTDGSTDPQVGSKARRKGGEGGSGGKSDLKDQLDLQLYNNKLIKAMIKRNNPEKQVLVSENEEPTLNELNLGINEMFERVKAILSSDATNGQKQEREFTLRRIIKAIGQKVNKPWEGSSKEFIGMLVIYLYAIRFQQIYSLSLNFQSVFYHNVNSVLQRTYEEWSQSQLTNYSLKANNNLTTLLFVFSSFCEIAENNSNKKIPLKKLLNPLIMETFLKLELPDDQKILKYYKNVMLQIFKRKQFVYQKHLLVSSSARHFLASSSNTETQMVCLYILANSYKSNKDGGALDFQKRNQILKELRVMALQPEKRQTFGLALLLGSKLLKSQTQEGIRNFISHEEFALIVQQKEKFQFNANDIQAIIGFMKTFDEPRLLHSMSFLFSVLEETLIAKKIVNEILGFLMPQIVLQLLELNLIGKLQGGMSSGDEEVVLVTIDSFKKIAEKASGLNIHFESLVKERIKSALQHPSLSTKHLEPNYSILANMLAPSLCGQDQPHPLY